MNKLNDRILAFFSLIAKILQHTSRKYNMSAFPFYPY